MEDFETSSPHRIVKVRGLTVELLWNITEKYNLLHPGNWSLEVETIVKQYQREVVAAEAQGFDGNDIPQSPWDFSGALLFSITVITTIGEFTCFAVHLKGLLRKMKGGID